MKPLLGMIGGFLTSLFMFVSGVAVATYFLYAEPEPRAAPPSVDVSDLWTGEPRTVNTSVQPFERLPALQQASQTETSAGPRTATTPSASVDPIATGALQTAPEDADTETAFLTAAHAQWCANRYRSYRPADNSYTSFNRGQRLCVSPFSRELEAAAKPQPRMLAEAESFVDFAGEEPLLQYASDDGNAAASAGSDHTSYCFNRYRSYRPEDNSYQPFGGGPRRQCR